jgi:hypothetical protein
MQKCDMGQVGVGRVVIVDDAMRPNKGNRIFVLGNGRFI